MDPNLDPPTRWRRWVRLAGVLVWIMSAALIYFSEGALVDLSSIGLLLFVLLGVAALILSGPSDCAVSRRRIRKNPALNDDWVIRLSDEGRLDWSGFSSARR